MARDLKQLLASCDSIADVTSALHGIELEHLQPREIDVVHRAIQRCGPGTGLRIAYLGNHTLEPLPRYVTVAGLLMGIPNTAFLGEFCQYYQEILDPVGRLTEFSPDIILLSLDMRQLSPAVHAGFLCLDDPGKREELDRILAYIRDWANMAIARTSATILISNFPRPIALQAGSADGRMEFGESEFYLQLNLSLLREYKHSSRVQVFDSERVLAGSGRARAFDPKLYYLARMLWSEHAMPALASELVRTARAIRGIAHKCLALDLDNTLWGGVIGEDGAAGIKIGPGSPEGEAYAEFQKAILSLKERGVILAVCSKNNSEEVHEAFAARSHHMALRLEDFSVIMVNWEHKHHNLEEIANTLNIGTDSIVFVDDNPAEIELVGQLLPEVRTVLLPDDPALYADLIRQLPFFDRMEVTAEDRARTVQYRDEARRRDERRQISDIGAYLETLGTVVKLARAGAQHIPRIHQLFNKTNQFNLTTIRYAVADIEEFIGRADLELVVADVSDRFGALGIVGSYLVKRDGDSAVIDSFLLSCRALGRGIESAMMNRIKQTYLESGDCDSIQAVFVPTRKNAPAASFYEEQGFAMAGQSADGRRHYRLERPAMAVMKCSGMTIEWLER